MANVTARIKLKGRNFEILVDCDKALAYKKGQAIIEDAMASDRIFSDLRKGLSASEKELNEFFKTKDVKLAASKIIKEGEVQLPAEYKSKIKDDKAKQIVDLISRSCTDAKGIPHTPERIKKAMDEAHVQIDDRRDAEGQVSEIIKKLQPILPLKFESKKIQLKVPATYAGKVYGILHGYILKEEWLSDGSLLCILQMPAATQMSFYDKLNSITHGEAITQEIKE